MKCIPPEIALKVKEKLKTNKISTLEVSKMLPTEKAALKSVLEDFVTEKMGIKVKPEEIKQINKLSQGVDKAQKKLGDELGNPEKYQETVDFFVEKKKMDDYLQSLTPAHKLRVATGTIGRGMMLASVKSPVLNIGSNIEIGAMEAIARRITNLGTKGTDTKQALKYMKMTNDIYKKTGYDISRMTSLSDTGSMGERVLGKIVHTQGPGATRRAGRIVENIVFKNLMGAPDVAFSSAHFADSVNLQARNVGKTKAEAKTIMTDAMRIDPKTPEGLLVRQQGILDAEVATWTNNSWASKVTLSLRKVFNDASGDLRLGDNLYPFIKTPANVIETGMDYAGFGIPKAMVKTVNAVRTGTVTKPVMQSAARDIVRSGLGIAGAAMITAQLDDDDFVGAYDPSRYQIEQLRNSNYNAIRIGNKWISTDWLGPLAVSVTSMMYARKHGKAGKAEFAFQYVKGTGGQVLNLPVISDIRDSIRHSLYQEDKTLAEMSSDSFNYITGFISSRLIPSFLSDVARATDPYNRKANEGVEAVKAKIPVLRQTLPEKEVLGEPSKSEPGLSTILFGSRVKTSSETPVISEVNSISNSVGKSLNFTDLTRSSSKTLGQFKEKVGEDKYKEATTYYGEVLREELEKEISSRKYQNMSDEDKYKVISNTDSEAMDKVFKKYRFKYKSQK